MSTLEIKAQIETLKAELTGYVGEKQSAHSVSMIEDSWENYGLKRGGKAWLRRVHQSLVERLTEPTQRRVSQISPETLEWGGFMSDTVTYVRGPSLRDQGRA